jgi:nitrogen fixation NifU-like protein
VSDSLYNEAIVAAGRDRSHAGRLDHPDRSVTRDNPLCGDRVTLDLALDGRQVREVAHKTRGCLLTEAAAALLARRLAAPEPPLSAADLLASARRWLDKGGAPPWPELALFEPVRAVRSRHECVLLPFEALAEALPEESGGAAQAEGAG